jgi:hypothetical protein
MRVRLVIEILHHFGCRIVRAVTEDELTCPTKPLVNIVTYGDIVKYFVIAGTD